MIIITAVVLALIASPPHVEDALLGVRVGSAAADVQKKLAPLGTGESRRTRDGGSKHVWTLTGTPFASLALKLDAAGRVVWVTGFVRPGQEIPFRELGDLRRARAASDASVVWHVSRADGGYRLIARGRERRAQTVSLLAFGIEAEQ